MKKEEILRSKLVRAAGFGPGTEVFLLVEQGSDRLFHRLRDDKKSAVLMLSSSDDPDFDRYVEIGRYLNKKKLGAPEILETDPATKSLVMEDLGDDTLYAFAGRSRGEAAFAEQYRQVVDLLAAMQTETRTSLDECPAARDRALDYKTLRWETRYFRENVLEGEFGLSAGETAPLEDEFHRLAEAVKAQPLSFIHRDFQSQNILIKDGRVRLVDFQGARRGSLAYDLASLLKDAYVDISKELCAGLLDYFRKRLAAAAAPALSPAELGRAYLLAGLQRNMQALGAFAFLSRIKKKAGFKRFIAPGLARLHEGVEELNKSKTSPGPLPRLAAICAKLERLRSRA